MLPLPPISTLFPYTTLFRSRFTLVKFCFYIFIKKCFHSSHSPVDNIRFFFAVVANADLHQPPDRRNLQRIIRSEEHTSELQSLAYLVCRLLLEKKKQNEL